jgi:hypothetical protein
MGLMRASFALFVGVSLLGTVALFGFFNPVFAESKPERAQSGPVEL